MEIGMYGNLFVYKLVCMEIYMNENLPIWYVCMEIGMYGNQQAWNLVNIAIDKYVLL